MPLPCERTLRRKLEHIQFEEGICDDIFKLLEDKISQFQDVRERDCILVLDEMSIAPGESVEATHGLIIVLAGIFSRWKQNIALYFTPESYDGALLHPIVLEINQKAESIGLYVHSVVVPNDMGPNNLAMWRTFRVGFAGRHLLITNSIIHRVDNNRKLWFIADTGHLLKNLKYCLLNNKTITLPEKFTNANNLSSSVVYCSHLEELAELQENLQLKLTSKIKVDYFSSSTFQKMKVNKAKNFFSRDVSGSLKFITTQDPKKEYQTTALFIEIISKWFTVMTSHTPNLALRKLPRDEVSKNKFEQTIAFLESIIDIFQEMLVGNGTQFNPATWSHYYHQVSH
ncbi:uncharacterized protein LOC112588667 [Harpegnathos saltator]|uniref:uncharacterized protein LOC112588667 n=1 Tax=Harpegnathos saltator TaxID=610380 RepID=UPI000DBED983|nr:uncharacterized protein LOC112588667 [Harpegnathos saltator]